MGKNILKKSDQIRVGAHKNELTPFHSNTLASAFAPCCKGSVIGDKVGLINVDSMIHIHIHIHVKWLLAFCFEHALDLTVRPKSVKLIPLVCELICWGRDGWMVDDG